jgi:hypothetical protein
MIRNLIYRLTLPLRLRRHAAIRQARAEAARRGVHTYWKRAGAKRRQMFGETT